MNCLVHHGDVLDVLRTLPDASFDAILSDPPYELSNDGKASPGSEMIDAMPHMVERGSLSARVLEAEARVKELRKALDARPGVHAQQVTRIRVEYQEARIKMLEEHLRQSQEQLGALSAASKDSMKDSMKMLESLVVRNEELEANCEQEKERVAKALASFLVLWAVDLKAGCGCGNISPAVLDAMVEDLREGRVKL